MIRDVPTWGAAVATGAYFWLSGPPYTTGTALVALALAAGVGCVLHLVCLRALFWWARRATDNPDDQRD